MFDSLSDRLGDVFDRLRRHGALTEDDVGSALREIRIALLEADVALPVVRDFVAAVREKALGQEVLRSVTPAQMVVKIVHDHLVEVLGGGLDGARPDGIDLNAPPPVVVMLVGLQGSGKTTTAAKGYDVVILDTAGRLHVNEELMLEVAAVREAANPNQTLLVADAMTGQDAVNVAKAFGERAGITAIVLTRVDGDARGGAALSMRAITGKPIVLMGMGERIEALEEFHAERIAGRILGMGDVVSLVEKAAETVDEEEAEKLAAKLEKGRFDLDDLAAQLRQIRRMGGMGGMLGLLPGVAKLKKQLGEANIDEGIIKRQEAIISSMTKSERRNPKLLNGSRRRRIASGSGTTVPEINRLLKQYQDMADITKRMKKLGNKGLMRHGLAGLLPGGFR
jgi:signal recognition particle subunit SRP54